MSLLLVVPPLADSYGRKKIVLATLLVQLITMLAIINCSQTEVALAGMFVMGACMSGRVTVCYTYLQEFMTDSNKVIVTTV